MKRLLGGSKGQMMAAKDAHANRKGQLHQLGDPRRGDAHAKAIDGSTITISGGLDPVDIYSDAGFKQLSDLWTKAGWQRKLSYELTWLGVPIIQIPEDILMMQELLYKLRPAVVIETGVAHGGSAIF